MSQQLPTYIQIININNLIISPQNHPKVIIKQNQHQNQHQLPNKELQSLNEESQSSSEELKWSRLINYNLNFPIFTKQDYM
jgi:hypothetical protein